MRRILFFIFTVFTVFGVFSTACAQNANIDILWTADTYVPPFYRGKALASPGSIVRVVAIPHFSEYAKAVSEKDLIYKWKQHTLNRSWASGIGKTSYEYQAKYADTSSGVGVSISTADKEVVKDVYVSIPVSNPKLLIYEDRPLEGVRYENALENQFFINQNEITFSAEPYFFSFQSKNDNDGKYEWTINGKTVLSSEDKKSEFTLGKPIKGSGEARVALSISKRVDIQGIRLPQSETKTISVKF